MVDVCSCPLATGRPELPQQVPRSPEPDDFLLLDLATFADRCRNGGLSVDVEESEAWWCASAGGHPAGPEAGLRALAGLIGPVPPGHFVLRATVTTSYRFGRGVCPTPVCGKDVRGFAPRETVR